MKNKKIIGVIAVALLVGVGYLLLSSGENSVVPVGQVATTSTVSASTTQIEIKNSSKSKTTINMNTEQVNTQTVRGAIISTNLGDIEVEFSDATAPKTVANFVSLVSTHFYDSIKFHRVISGFMIQAGDPLTKDDAKASYWGTGGPGYQFADELSGKEVYAYGTLAMANSGKNTNGSQFFIVSANPSVALPPSYTVFGKVTGGMDVVEKIQNVPTDRSNDRPIDPVVIKTVTLR